MPTLARIAAAAAVAAALIATSADAFLCPAGRLPPSATGRTAAATRASEANEDALLFADDDRDGGGGGECPPQGEDGGSREQSVPWKRNARWNSLSPNVKRRIVEEAQERAIRNKERREPAADRKRRMMMHYKEAQRKKKRDSRVRRPTPFADRAPLADIPIGAELNGTVISLTNFGAYVDVGTECDGLLHVGQLRRDVFVEHPRQVLSPGDVISVRVLRSSPELRKLQLTMLPAPGPADPDDDVGDDDDDADRIPLGEIDVDDELWGEIVRVTSYGAYVELGAEVEGFLHFMDHPNFGLVAGAPPSDYMRVGDRVRVWVSDVDEERGRVKLTANRPPGLPGPRREIRMR